MFKRIHWRQYVPFAVIAAIVYCIPVFFFIREANYTQSWLLYVGNFLFLFVIVAFLVSFNRKRNENAGSVTMVAAGHITTIMGILSALVLSALLLVIFIPGIFHAEAGKVLQNAPANTEHGNTNGLVFKVFANAIVGNMATGSFVSIMLPFTLKGDQTKESTPRQQREL